MQQDVWEVTKDADSQHHRLRATTIPRDNSTETLLDRDSRTILSRYEDNTTAPQDALRSLQIVNHAKMTVHYHFHDHQHADEREPGQPLVEKDTNVEGPVAQIDTVDPWEQPEPGEIRSETPFGAEGIEYQGMRTTHDEVPTRFAKRALSETVSSTTHPAKRVKEEDGNRPSHTTAPMNIHSLQALFANHQSPSAPVGPAQPVASQPKPVQAPPAKALPSKAKKCRHCKIWFNEKDNHNSACGVHTGKLIPSVVYGTRKVDAKFE